MLANKLSHVQPGSPVQSFSLPTHTHITQSDVKTSSALLQLEKLILTRVGFAALVISSIGKRFSNWFVLVRISLPELRPQLLALTAMQRDLAQRGA